MTGDFGRKLMKYMKRWLAYAPAPVYAVCEWVHLYKERREKGEDSTLCRREKSRKVHCLGDKDPDKTYYVIALDEQETGIASMMIYLLGHFKYADKMHYIPVIDSTMYRPWLWGGPDEEVAQCPWRKGLPWEMKERWLFYFKQPAGVTMQDIQDCKNVVFASPRAVDTPCHPMREIEMLKKRYMRKWNPLLKKYVIFEDDTAQYIEQQTRNIFREGRRVLGVSVRMGYVQGMKLKEKHYQYHNRQPDSIDIFIHDLERFRLLWKCDYIFLSTDDTGSADDLKKHFGSTLLMLDRMRTRITENGVFSSNPLLDVSISSNRAYLAELVILSKCQCYLGCINGGCSIVNVMNNGRFEHKYIYAMGKFEDV